jgi:hypothetical protein
MERLNEPNYIVELITEVIVKHCLIHHFKSKYFIFK